jgi:nitric oxide reductase subunit B
MTRTQQVAYGFFAQTVILLMLYAAVTLLGAVKFLADDPLAVSLPYHHVGALSNVLLHLTAVSGLLGGGIYVIASQQTDNRIPGPRLRDERLLGITFGLWAVVVGAAFAAGTLGLLEGRHLLELPPVLDIAQVIVIVLVLVNVTRSVSAWTPLAQVWTAGMSLSAVCSVIGLIPATNYVIDRLLRALAVGANLNVAHVLAAVALGYWLMHRFSDVPQGWADSSLYTVAGLVSLAGMLVTLPGFYPLGGVTVLSNLAVFVAPALYLILAAHSYKALSSRNATVTLAAHWYALGLLLFLLGPGLLGGLQAAPGIRQWTIGTRLTDLLATLTALAVIAIVLGVINQAAAELRGQNRRVTGLTPFWLVAFGIVGGGAALAGAGIAQTYLERILGVGYLETQTLIAPLYALWVLGWLSVALGAGIYALAFWARRPMNTR